MVGGLPPDEFSMAGLGDDELVFELFGLMGDGLVQSATGMGRSNLSNLSSLSSLSSLSGELVEVGDVVTIEAAALLLFKLLF